MGAPYFQCREVLESAGGIACSSNFALYGNFSERIMQILDTSLPEVFQYSIDEAFAWVDTAPSHNWVAECRKIRNRIRRWTGITVSVGIAPTKTLAKLANELAKKKPRYCGVADLSSIEECKRILQQTPIQEVWGIGRKLAPRMQGMGIRTAAGLSAASLDWLRQHFGVQGERLALELRGISGTEDVPQSNRSQIMVSRTLKSGVVDKQQFREALCGFVEKAGRLLRQENLMASELYVMMRTSRYGDHSRQYAAQQGCRLSCPTDDTRILTHAATTLMESLYSPDYTYRKLGVLLADLQESRSVQPTFEQPNVAPSQLMKVLDSLQKSGHDVHFANKASEPLWQSSKMSPCYTTRWDALPEAW